MLDISKYIETGSINNLKVGATLIRVEEELGEIQDYEKMYFDTSDPTAGFSIYRDGIEYMFIDYKLYGINIDMVDNQFCLNPFYQSSPHTPLSVLLAFLTYKDLEWSFYSKDTYDKTLAIQLESGVKFSYQYNEDNELVLIGFYSYAKIK